MEQVNFYRNLPVPIYTTTPPTVDYPNPYTTEFKTIRTATQRITDSGHFKQHFDVVSFDTYGINLNTIKQQGYKTITFHIRLDVREIDDGYQHLFLFSSASQSNDYLLASRQFEHSPSKDTTWWVHYENELYFRDIAIDKFVNNQFIIRYDGSGKNNDTWENWIFPAHFPQRHSVFIRLMSVIPVNSIKAKIAGVLKYHHGEGYFICYLEKTGELYSWSYEEL